MVVFEGVVVLVGGHQEHLIEDAHRASGRMRHDLPDGMAQDIIAHRMRDQVDTLVAGLDGPRTAQIIGEFEQSAREGGPRGRRVLAVVGIGDEGHHRAVRRPGEQHDVDARPTPSGREVALEHGGAGQRLLEADVVAVDEDHRVARMPDHLVADAFKDIETAQDRALAALDL